MLRPRPARAAFGSRSGEEFRQFELPAEELLQQGFHGVGIRCSRIATQQAVIDFGAEAARCQQGEAGHQIRIAQGNQRGHCAAHGVAYQMDLRQLERLQGLPDSLCGNPSVADPRPVQRLAVPRQVERYGAFLRGQCRLDVEPGLPVAAEAVQQHDRSTVVRAGGFLVSERQMGRGVGT